MIARLAPGLRILSALTLLAAVVVLANSFGGWVEDRLDIRLTPSTEPAVHRTIMIAFVVYVEASEASQGAPRR